MSEIDKIAKWLRKTGTSHLTAEGRDKLCKIFQYVCRLVAAYYKDKS